MKRMLMLSHIPVEYEGEGKSCRTLDLWARDINVNSLFMGIDLLCPVRAKNVTSPQGALISEKIVVHDAEAINSDMLDELVSAVDVVQVPGNLPWGRAALGRQLIKTARRHKRVAIVGISSNRARTTMINSKDDPLMKRVCALLRSASIVLSQR